MKILNNLLKDEKDAFLVNTTAHINQTNPVVDRIMEDDTVDTVVMANREGSPILTNINVLNATRYAIGMRKLGIMVQNSIIEMAEVYLISVYLYAKFHNPTRRYQMRMKLRLYGESVIRPSLLRTLKAIRGGGLPILTFSYVNFGGMKILNNLLKDEKDAFLVNTTAHINQTNPVVDRIMEDDTVDTVVMANREGSPILTNINVLNATRYAIGMRKLGIMVQNSIIEMDPFDEALVFRIKTCKEEVMVAPHREFSIIVVQRERKRNQEKRVESKKKENAKITT